MTRKALRAIPEGTYRNVDYLDNDGIDLETPIRIEIAAIVKDGTITFDFEGTSPQVRGPLNCVPSGSLAAACFVVRALFRIWKSNCSTTMRSCYRAQLPSRRSRAT